MHRSKSFSGLLPNAAISKTFIYKRRRGRRRRGKKKKSNPKFGKLYLFFIISFSLALVSPSLFYKRWLEIEIYWFPNEKIHSI